MPRDLSVLVLFAEFGGLCREIDRVLRQIEVLTEAVGKFNRNYR